MCLWGTLVLPFSCMLLVNLTVTLISYFTFYSVGHTTLSQTINQSSNVTSERVDCGRKLVHPPGNYEGSTQYNSVGLHLIFHKHNGLM